MLDVAARAATALDFQGRRYGQAVDGGSIVIGGTVEHASGKADAAESFIDLRLEACWMPPAPRRFWTCPESARPGQQRRRQYLLASANGLYLDGDLRAFAGGKVPPPAA